MSATNWAACPRCTARMRGIRNERLQQATESYGKVSIEEFDRMRTEAEALPTEQHDGRGFDDGGYSLREDYNGSCSIDEDTGLFYVGYHAECQRCGFEYSFKVEEDTRAVAPTSTTVPREEKDNA